MPAATGTYHAWGPYLRDILKGAITPETAARYKMILTTTGFTPNLDSDQRYSDVTNEVYEGSWTQGGLVLANVLVNLVTASDLVTLTHDQVTAAEATFSSEARRVVIYDDTGATAADKRLAFTALLDSNIQPTAGPIVITSPNGIVRSAY